MNKNSFSNVLFAFLLILMACVGNVNAQTRIELQCEWGSAGFENQGPENSVDWNLSTKWCRNIYSGLSARYSTDKVTYPYSYSFYTGDDSHNGGRNPKTWTLKGYLSDNSTVVLSQITDYELPKGNKKKSLYFKVDPEKAKIGFTKYLLEIEDIIDHSEFTSIFEISEFVMYEGMHYFFTPLWSNYADGVSINETVVCAFDGLTDNKWCGKNYHQPVTVEFESSEYLLMDKYFFYTGDDVTNSGNNRNPKNWTLDARSSQKDNWVTIASETGDDLPTTNSTRSKDYSIYEQYKHTPYKYFRFRFEDVQKGDVFEIGELKLWGYYVDYDHPSLFGEENTANDNGVRTGRLKGINSITKDGATYTLYKDYSYTPIENGQKQTSQKSTVSGYSCVLTKCTATGTLNIPSTVEFDIYGTKTSVPVAAIGEGALGYGTNKVTSLSIPASIEIIEKSALEDRATEDPLSVSKLATLRFENSGKTLIIYRGSGAFGALGNDAALQNVYIGRNLECKASDNYILKGSLATNLSVTFDNSMTTLPANLLRDATGMKTVTLPEALTVVSESMCQNCIGLTSVTIPASVTRIERNAFKGCDNITTYTFVGENPCDISDVDCTLYGVDGFNIVIPDGKTDEYLSNSSWSKYDLHFPKEEVVANRYMIVTKDDGSTVSFDFDEIESVTWEKEHIRTSGTAKATINGNEVDVPWVQLWDYGPKFAIYNVGVTDGKPESKGGYYRWGKTEDSVPGGTYNTGDNVLSGSDDTATALWGSNWRMPTIEEYAELIDNSTVEELYVNGVRCCKFTGKGDYQFCSVIFPRCGVLNVIDFPYYWSSTPETGTPGEAMIFEAWQKPSIGNYTRSYNLAVRAVLNEE